MRKILRPAALLLLALGGCHSSSHDVPGDMNDHQPWHGIAASETVFLSGTEPFWSGKVEGNMLTYTTPEKPDGVQIPIERFAGRGGLSFGGELEGKHLTIALGPDDCSDGMSDRHYPFAATLQLGDETRMGCGWTTAHPATGPKAP
ncbi:COG3650 family protein [Novosphingobium colocasiae]|nr:hypothetical protein [Novosphingobium colocasiae]